MIKIIIKDYISLSCSGVLLSVLSSLKYRTRYHRFSFFLHDKKFTQLWLCLFFLIFKKAKISFNL